MLVGRTPDEAAKLVPMLYSICRHAQEAAARVALETAMDEPASADEMLRRARRVRLEAIQEHLWRLMLDWPALFDLVQLRDGFAVWHRRCTEAFRSAEPDVCRRLGTELVTFLDRTLLPTPLARWIEMADLPRPDEVATERELGPLLGKLGEFDAATDTGSPTGESLLPPDMTAHDLYRCLPEDDLDAFCRAPTLDRRAMETGALSRQNSRPLVAGLLARGRRLTARVVARTFDLVEGARELAEDRTVPAPWIDGHSGTGGIGLARVVTARGLLVHRVQMQAGRILRYNIVAPTEWNFHPDGALVREATGLRFDSNAQLHLRMRAMVLALDPCVAYQIEISHA